MFYKEEPGRSSWTLGEKIGVPLVAIVLVAACMAIVYFFGFWPSPALSQERLRPLVHYAIIERSEGSNFLDLREALRSPQVMWWLLGGLAIVLVMITLRGLRQPR